MDLTFDYAFRRTIDNAFEFQEQIPYLKVWSKIKILLIIDYGNIIKNYCILDTFSSENLCRGERNGLQKSVVNISGLLKFKWRILGQLGLVIGKIVKFDGWFSSDSLILQNI